MRVIWQTIGYDLLNLFFPRLCPACATAGLADSLTICLDCQAHLPYTAYHLFPDNPFTRRFWGRLPIQHGAAMLTFQKGGRVQHLLHQLKYRGRQDVGVYLGKMYGLTLSRIPDYRNVELILPVPLHTRRLHFRGYNQSACFAQGLSEALDIPWSDALLLRTAHTETQTNKSRMERFENVARAFEVPDPDGIVGKHILLVDDVLTTGATLEACGTLLLEIPGISLSLATIAMASD